MQAEPRYQDVVREVRDFLAAQLYEALDAGVAPQAIIIDPGIGFGKNLEHNLHCYAVCQPWRYSASRFWSAFRARLSSARF